MGGVHTLLERNCDQVILAASAAIRSRMKLGSRKYDPCAWRSETVGRHVRKAIRHAVTEMEGTDGDYAFDEDHLAAAVCRMAMALAVRDQPKRDGISKTTRRKK